jgi:hypothetical protein
MAGEVAAGEVLAQSLADCEAFWDALKPLSPAQERLREFERELRTNCAAAGCGVPAADDSIIAEIRSGAWERRQKRIGRDMSRDRAKMTQWKREGYTFDEDRRLVAPALTRIAPSRGTSRENRPQGRRVARSGSNSRDGPSDESDLPPVAPLRGFTAASIRMVQHYERRRAKAAAV